MIQPFGRIRGFGSGASTELQARPFPGSGEPGDIDSLLNGGWYTRVDGGRACPLVLRRSASTKWDEESLGPGWQLLFSGACAARTALALLACGQQPEQLRRLRTPPR